MDNQEKKPEDVKSDFLEAHKKFSYIYDRPDSYESKMMQNLTTLTSWVNLKEPIPL
jgi:hypothetical protein